MQPEQQLQWKKSQAQSRLLSRKRKLAELFSVTALESVDEYKSKLRAFQDANNLERGRLFDEATLPPRTQITRHSLRSHVSRSINTPVALSPTPPRQKSPRKIDAVLSPKAIEKSSLPSPGPQTPEQREVVEDGLNEIGVEQPKGLVKGQISNEDEKAKVSPMLRSVEENGRRPDSMPLSPSSQSKSINAKSTGSDTQSSSTEEKGRRGSTPVGKRLGQPIETSRRSRSPLVIDQKINIADPQSSPTSTNDQISSNTPVQGAGSPDTSPEEERHTPNSSESIPGKPSEVGGMGTPKRPETPDSTQEPTNHDVSLSSMDIDVNDNSIGLDGVSPIREPGIQAIPETQSSSSKRPFMRINTQTDISSYFKPQPTSGMVESPAQITGSSATPRQAAPPTPSGQDTSKRATRISSGVLQKKSVSEILGEAPKNASSSESPLSAEARDGFSQATSQGRLADRERREKERSKLSTVVFAKPQRPHTDEDATELTKIDRPDPQKTPSNERDYLYTLFENKAYSMTRQGSMGYLIANAHKTLSTADHLVEYELQAECRILKRLYQLQEKQRWSLRQYKRAEEAPRPTSHWDFLLDHAKWMRTDFREERKWKLAAARSLAESCAEWVESSPETRKSLQIKTKPPKHITAETHHLDVVMEDGPGPALLSQPTPELVPSHDDASVSDDLAEPRDLPIIAPPAAIFSLGASDFNFAVDKTPAFDKLLNELPLYEPAPIEPDLSKSKLAEKLDLRWKTDIVPVSRFATEKLHVSEFKSPLKRSRYEYEIETAPTRKTTPLPPQDADVALFMPENKHIRDRIHPGHSFRPPSEYPMPTQAFFETRSSSQWTQTEDDELRKLVKDYSYNWSLISSCLTPRSLYTSGADRRTPWECFERWIGLEGLPADMSKTPYFKTYSGRIEAAGRHVQAQLEEAQRRAGANVQIAARKRTTQPVRVERKRTQRHLAMLDAMRKLAKKRETAIQKQQHQADIAAMRKVNEVNAPKAPYSKPSEFAALKLEREQKLAERQEIYRQQLIAHQRATAQAQRGQPQPNGMPNGLPANANAIRGPVPPNSIPGVPNANLQVPNGHPRPHPSMMGVPNGIPMPQGMVGPKGLAQAQAQMQANLARAAATSPQQMRILQEASKVQQEQMMRQAQQAQAGSHSSPNGPHASLANGKGLNNPAYMAALAMANGVPSPSTPMNGTAGSPRSQGATAGQALSSGHVPLLTQIANKIREQYPTMPDEEVQKMASQQIQAWQQQTATAAAAGQGPKRVPPHNQAAVNAAMGAVNAAAHASNVAAAAAAAAASGYPQQGMMTNEQVQQYNQRMRLHQAQQHAARGMQPGQMPPGMVAGMSNSPVMNMARPVSQHTNQGQMSRSATPRDQRSGSQSNVNGNA